ncbi:MAG: S8 family serine peptidase, partial [Thermoguttaceae bacterium]|nr:S8 family serine peptidase [Thermoguttaceae bacterium]
MGKRRLGPTAHLSPQTKHSLTHRKSSRLTRIAKDLRPRRLQLEPLENRLLLDIAGSFLQWQLASNLLGQFDAKDSKVDWNLLAAAKTAVGDWRPEDLGGQRPVATLLGDMIVVDAVAQGDPALLIQDLVGLGAQITGQFQRMVSALVPAAAIPILDSLDSLAYARGAGSLSRMGLTTTQGDIAIGANILRQWFGLDGSGQKVGVLSDSFDALGGAAVDVSTGDLPGPGNPNGYLTPVQVLSDFPGGTDEGRAMLQIIHDIAPGASLAFASALYGEAAFAQSILDLATAGCNVIVDDVIYFAEPMFMDGGVAQAVDQVVAAGVTYFSAAGNEDRFSYERQYNPSGVYVSVGSLVWELHDFDPGLSVDVTQKITLPVGEAIVVVFQWQDPFATWAPGSGGATRDFDIALIDVAESTVLAWSIDDNLGGDPVEMFYFVNDGSYDFDGDSIPDTEFNLVLLHAGGPVTPPPLLKTVAFSLGGFQFMEWDTASGTSYGHANAAGSFATGAAFYQLTPAYGVSPPLLNPYSSAGGVPILFDFAGNPLPAPEIRQTPDAVAPDGVNTTFFGWDYEGDGLPNFFGTSAAAPHAAALAALLRQAAPALTPAQIYAAMENSAIDMGPAGYEFDSGWGLIEAFGALLETGASVPIYFIGTPADDDMLIRLDAGGADLQFWLNGSLVFSFPYSRVTSVFADGLQGNDTLTIDWGNGIPVPAGGVSFNGSAGADSLALVGGSANTIAHRLDGPSTGQVLVDGYLINYAALEPIVDNLDVVNRVFTFTNAVPDGRLTRVSATLTRIASGVSEFVDFTTPTGSLTINLAAGPNSFTVLGLADDYGTPVNVIVGNTGDDFIQLEATRGVAALGPLTWTVLGNAGDDRLRLAYV